MAERKMPRLQKAARVADQGRATTGAISASGVITKPGLQTSKPSAPHVAPPGKRAMPQGPTYRER